MTAMTTTPTDTATQTPGPPLLLKQTSRLSLLPPQQTLQLNPQRSTLLQQSQQIPPPPHRHRHCHSYTRFDNYYRHDKYRYRQQYCHQRYRYYHCRQKYNQYQYNPYRLNTFRHFETFLYF